MTADQRASQAATATALAHYGGQLPQPPALVRKHSKFQTCERHRGLASETRRRRAEFFVEGGPAGQAGCTGGLCRLWPGTDLFSPDICTEEFPLDWTVAP